MRYSELITQSRSYSDNAYSSSRIIESWLPRYPSTGVLRHEQNLGQRKAHRWARGEWWNTGERQFLTCSPQASEREWFDAPPKTRLGCPQNRCKQICAIMATNHDRLVIRGLKSIALDLAPCAGRGCGRPHMTADSDLSFTRPVHFGPTTLCWSCRDTCTTSF